MLVIHKAYGKGYADEPYIDNGFTLIKVHFNNKTIVFSYPKVFKEKILVQIPEKIDINKNTLQSVDLLNSKLLPIIFDYIADFNEKKNNEFVVKNSIPIIWFGDINKYLQSKRKILTIGLNPSDKEFSEPRFKPIDFNKPDNDIVNHLIETLNNYFSFNPYKWFNQFEKLLNFFDCSYKPLYTYQAIHIDFFSSIATTPTWGNLDDYQKNQLKNIELFFKLYHILDPDLSLISISKTIFERCFKDWTKIDSKQFNSRNSVSIYTKNNKFIINGTNGHGKPFGCIKEKDLESFLVNLNFNGRRL